jgi:predicted porin
LAGGFGTVRVGRFVPAAALGFHGFSGAASTSQGSLYAISNAGGTSGARFVPNAGARGAATVGASDQFMSGGNFERGNNRIQYTSPNFMGVVANVDYSAVSSDSDVATATGKAKTTQTGLSLTYTQGPISAGFGTNNRTVTGEASAATAGLCAPSAGGAPVAVNAGNNCAGAADVRLSGANAVGESKAKATLQWLGASYDLGMAKISAAHVTRKDETTVAAAGTAAINADIAVTSYGVSVPMGKITLGASAYTGENKNTAASTDDMKLSGHQVSARYAFSKRTTAYALMGTNNVKRDGATNTTSPTRKESVTMAGLVHSF